MSKRFVLFGHPLHPPITHFVMGILPLGFAWQVAGMFSDDGFWWKAAFWTILAGTVMAIPAATTGLLEYLTLPRDSAAFQTATNHMLVMLTAVCVFVAALFVQGGSGIPASGRDLLTLGAGLLGTLILLGGGWLGGELVHRYRIGHVD